eukprot:scaffold3522_cov100-Isochrysis_galbana.AAC.1
MPGPPGLPGRGHRHGPIGSSRSHLTSTGGAPKVRLDQPPLSGGQTPNPHEPNAMHTHTHSNAHTHPMHTKHPIQFSHTLKQAAFVCMRCVQTPAGAALRVTK